MSNTSAETPEIRSDAAAAEIPNPSHLENEKLKLEVQLLGRQLSKRWLALEWLKSGTVLVALIGVGVTLWAGYGQVKQAEQSRISERLDKALTRLASDKSNERVTGVSSLRLFLNEEDRSLRAQALHFLVDAAAVEADPLVQSAILDVFADLKRSEVSQSDLDSLLKTVIERNRSLANSIRNETPERIRQDKRQKLAGFERLNLKLDQVPNEIPQSLIKKLTLTEYLDLYEAERGTFAKLDPKRGMPLQGVSRLIATLLKLGAKATDFSRISCQWCDFSAARDLSGANFDKANLEHANFSRVNLQKASFQEANLSDTIFFAADLSNANLKNNTLEVDWSTDTNGLPLFECANLKGADLTGTPLLYYGQEFNTDSPEKHAVFNAVAPRMLSTQIDKTTNLEYFTIIVTTNVSDAYLIKYANAERFALWKRKETSLDDPIVEYGKARCAYRRFKADYYANDEDETLLSSTTCIQLVTINSGSLVSILPGPGKRLSGFLDQPSLSDVPLLLAFNKHLESPRSQRWKSVSEYACDDISVPDGKKLKMEVYFSGRDQ